MAAVEKLIDACNAKQVDVSAVLHELAFDIDDAALDGEAGLLANDPFYWSV